MQIHSSGPISDENAPKIRMERECVWSDNDINIRIPDLLDLAVEKELGFSRMHIHGRRLANRSCNRGRQPRSITFIPRPFGSQRLLSSIIAFFFPFGPANMFLAPFPVRYGPLHARAPRVVQSLLVNGGLIVSWATMIVTDSDLRAEDSGLLAGIPVDDISWRVAPG